MRCPECGNVFIENSRFCPHCGKQVLNNQASYNIGEDSNSYTSQGANYSSGMLKSTFRTNADIDNRVPVEEVPSFEYTPEYPDNSIYQPVYEDAPIPKKKKSKGKIVLIVILSVLLLLVATFATLYFATDVFGDGECDLCGKSIIKFNDYCSSCEKELTCTQCGKFDKNTVDGYCTDCRRCRHCKENIDVGFYCLTCLDNNDNNNMFACISCTIETGKSNGYLAAYKYVKTNMLLPEEICFLDKNGMPYCRNCLTKKTCEYCGGYLKNDDDDSVCAWCASNDYCEGYMVCAICMLEVVNEDEEFCSDCGPVKHCAECDVPLSKKDDDDKCSNCSEYVCYVCDEVLERKEISHTYSGEDYSLYYCENCDTGKYCRECEDLLDADDDDSICSYCTDSYCYSCDEVLDTDEIVHTKQSMYEDGTDSYYCENCDTGKYCNQCDAVLSLYDADTICYNCADVYCWECSEVLSPNEASHKYYKNDSKYYICSHCDTKHYCEECKTVLHETDDDDVCYYCSDSTCYGCSEVLGNDEISHRYYDSEGYCYYWCNDCDTEKYCDDCGYVLSKNDDDSKCYTCAEKVCWWCSEVLSRPSEISHTADYYYDDYNVTHYYFCEGCDTNNYCRECDWPIPEDDDDDVCTSCADYICWYCNEVLYYDEVSYTRYDYNYGYSQYFCEDCDTGNYCTDCDRILDEGEEECWWCDE